MKRVLKKYKFFLITILCFVVISTAYYGVVNNVSKNYNGITIVLDAGHGGRDGGSVGANGTIEKEINLKYVLTLKEKLVRAGYKVVLTRENDDGLYNNLSKNKKQDDMNKRMDIIKKSNPNLVLSLHMNSFPDSSAYGAMTYYRAKDEASNNCADLIQKSISTYCNARSTKSKEGDYFMLNCSYYTSVLIECGFLSNRDEERMLNTDEYRERMTDAIYKGILLYFGQA